MISTRNEQKKNTMKEKVINYIELSNPNLDRPIVGRTNK